MYRAAPLAFFTVLSVSLLVPPLWADELATYKFRGIEPGVTGEQALIENERWGQPLKREQTGDGSTWLEFAARGYRSVGVLLRGGKVQSIDITLPEGVAPETAAAALKLGQAVADEALPFVALLGGPVDQSWQGTRYSAGRVVVFSDDAGKAQLVRAYAAEVIGDRAPAPPAPPDSPAAAEAAEATALTGQDATGRQVLLAVTKLLAAQHLSQHPLDDEIAQRTLGLFLKELDAAQLYFLHDDVAEFRRRYDLLDDQLRSGDLSLAYRIFEVYLERVRQRVALAEQLLDAEHDFGVDEYMQAEAAAYAENELEIREIWRKRIKYDLLVQRAAGQEPQEARRIVSRRYGSFLTRMQRLGDEELRNMVLNSLAAAYDPHTSYISPAQMEDFRINTAAQLFGIGASQQMVDGYVTIQSVLPGGPAASDGRLQPGDRILAVGQGDGPLVDVVNADLSDVVRMIRGEAGTVVRLRVLPKEEFESAVYELTRAKIELNQIGHAVLAGEQLPAGRTGKLGFIRLPSFYLDMEASREGREDFRSCTRDVQRILGEFIEQGVDAVVLDLRNNTGGSLAEAINLPALFIGGNPLILLVKGADGAVQSYAAQDIEQVWKGPLVVLTNTTSAGGSEIVAAAVQDYQRGLVIGDSQTHGMGTVAQPIDLGQQLFRVEKPPQLGYLKLVIQKYYRPNGDSMQLRGVVPDVAFPSLTDRVELTENQLSYALKFDRVQPGQYTPSSDFPLDEELRQLLRSRSAARRTGSSYFQNLNSRIARYEARRTEPVPLNAEEFLAQRNQPSPPSGDAQPIPGLPEVKRDEQLAELLAISLDFASRMHYASAERQVARTAYAEAIAGYRTAVAADPDFTQAHYKLAWHLATCPQSRLRDGDLAVQHATKACELDGRKSWHYLLALSIAEAEAGDFESAQRDVKSALDMAPPDKAAPYRYLEERFQRRQAFRDR